MRDKDIRSTQEEVSEETPPYSGSTIDAFLIGDQCSEVCIVQVPPDLGFDKATAVEHVAFDIWVMPHNVYAEAVIDMTSRFFRTNSVLTKSGAYVPLGMEFTICYAEQRSGEVNTIIKKLTGGCLWIGNLLVFKHDRSGGIVNVVDADSRNALAAVDRWAILSVSQSSGSIEFLE
ncbi:hypothetical protein Hypma_002443 [Hypsizygus marmoreus]|uniref:Uncharacterized protein n=1 Tax=Hypsizygus marmoreus TaxID=39966 RepID=A0A369J8E3_HYPMA|nr:hypothetical protein Hypma_002443 [Hypsizygus marmoreus]